MGTTKVPLKASQIAYLVCTEFTVSLVRKRPAGVTVDLAARTYQVTGHDRRGIKVQKTLSLGEVVPCQTDYRLASPGELFFPANSNQPRVIMAVELGRYFHMETAVLMAGCHIKDSHSGYVNDD